MTKRWSSTASLDGQTKRQAAKRERRLTREDRELLWQALLVSSEFVYEIEPAQEKNEP